MSVDNIFGQVDFVTYVCVYAGERPRHKRVKLATVHCEFKDRFEVARKFVAENQGIKEIHAHFIACEHVL